MLLLPEEQTFEVWEA